ncbi:MAG: response regulator transcription factor [Desulfobacteraceae bacterium]|nr:response regulator transcription factor [Desulfobacteraceae bacterium]
MNIVIIEDEYAAVQRMKKLLTAMDPSTKILAVLEGVDDAVCWFKENDAPDLAFVDVQLADGICFEIFDAIEPECPLIFVTAYDQYAIQAFKVNSIDYLLKPVDSNELEQSIRKYHRVSQKGAMKNPGPELNALMNHLAAMKQEYKSRFLVKSGEAFHSISCLDLAYFFIEDQLVRLKTCKGKTYILDQSLDELEKALDPKQFHRINRQMVVHFSAIQSVHKWFNNRLKLSLSPAHKHDVIVSRKKVKLFKKWLDR